MSVRSAGEIFGEAETLALYLGIEVALAHAQAEVGVIPEDAAREIERGATLDAIDVPRVRQEAQRTGYAVAPLVRQLTEACGDAGRFVHWGATTQDIVNTALALQVDEAFRGVLERVERLARALAALVRSHRHSVMAGRTFGGHALPITFGFKAAVWLSSVDRHIERVAQVKPRVLVGEFAGAAGTLASVGERGLEMQQLFCEELGLGQPAITWHVARDGLAEAVTLLGLITGTLGKIATDVMLMSATEFGEVSEPFVHGRGASSTMPQKRNPISSELMLAAAKAVRQHVATMLDAMIHDFERATGPWHLEWASLPESFLLAGASLANAKFMLAGLVVHEKRMLDNLGLTRGLIVAEAVMMAAAPKLGRQHAHDVVYAACREAIEGDGNLADILGAVPEIVEALGGVEAIRRHCDPANYLGLSGKMVDRAIAAGG